jgi:membrane protease YdiL (CAAX protease family)
VNIDMNQTPLTKLLYILCATIVIQTSILSFYGRFVTSGPILYEHFTLWERLVLNYYSVSVFLTVLITIGAIVAFYCSHGAALNKQSIVAESINNHARNLVLGIGGGVLAFALSLPLLTRGDPAAKLGARLLSQSLGLSWESILVLLIVLLVLPVTIEIFLCHVVIDTLANYVSVPAVLVASSLLFAFLWPVFNSVAAVTLGAISVLLYHRTRSITAPIVASIVLTMSGLSFTLFQNLRLK